MSRFVHSHPAELILIYDWQGGEFSRRLGADRADSREELKEKIEQGKRIICYRAEEAEAEPDGEGFEWFCEMAFDVGGVVQGRKLVTVDECQELIDPYNLPPSLGKLLKRGRRRRIDTLIAGDAPNALQHTARNQVTELYVFRLTDDSTLKYPASLGMDSERIRALPDGRFIFRDMRTGEERELDLWGRKSKAGETLNTKEL